MGLRGLTALSTKIIFLLVVETFSLIGTLLQCLGCSYISDFLVLIFKDIVIY